MMSHDTSQCKRPHVGLGAVEECVDKAKALKRQKRAQAFLAIFGAVFRK
jgi:hypothetical protein